MIQILDVLQRNAAFFGKTRHVPHGDHFEKLARNADVDLFDLVVATEFDAAERLRNRAAEFFRIEKFRIGKSVVFFRFHALENERVVHPALTDDDGNFGRFHVQHGYASAVHFSSPYFYVRKCG